MSSMHNRSMLPEAKMGFDQFKVEIGRGMGVGLNLGGTGEFTSKNVVTGTQTMKTVLGDFNQELK